ncbi:MAG TPA: sarcosine oxidase subunit gamma family protein [Streptosporangiaceae bacterium]|nr:sarcosine oxidase subunit gamma family protein [Streptosporangiaceae bacterium]
MAPRASTEVTIVARSPVRPGPPVIVTAGWEVSGSRAQGELTLTDCTPLAKVQLRAPAAGKVADLLGVPFGRAARDQAGTLVAGAGPGEWLLLAPPGQAAEVAARLEDVAGQAPGELVSVVDLTHGRALLRLTGSRVPDVLSAVCGIDLSDTVTPDGAALRTSVAALATDMIRDDAAGARSYLLHCERSSGQYLFDALRSAGRDWGIEVDGFRLPGI